MPLAAIALAVVAAILDAWSSAHYAPDFRDFMSGGARFIANANLYEGSGAFNGFIGPSFQAMFHAPVAAIFAINPNVALAVWTIITFAALIAGVRVWARTLSVPASSPAVLVAILVVAFPIYREFQAQNMTTLLFLFSGLAARALLKSRDGEAGAWVALGAALKFYPGFPLAYFAARGRWRMAFAGAATLAGLLLLPILRLGVSRFIWLWQEWIRSRQTSVWPMDFQSQSLPHVVRLFWLGDGRAQAATAMFLVLVAGAMLVAWSRRRMPLAAGEEMAFATLIGFVASPIGWIVYWILAIPALIVVSRDAASQTWSRIVLILSVLFGLVVGPVVRDHPRGEYLVIAIALLVTLTWRLVAAAGKPAAPTVV